MDQTHSKSLHVIQFDSLTDFSNADNEDESDVSVTPEGSSEEEEEDNYQNNKSKREQMKKQSERIANGKGKPLPLKVCVQQ